MKLSSIGLSVAVAVCGLGGYSLGTGWIRIGPPGDSERHPPRADSTALAESQTPVSVLQRERTRDDAVVRSGTGSGLLGLAMLEDTPAGSSTSPATTGAAATPSGGAATPSSPATGSAASGAAAQPAGNSPASNTPAGSPTQTGAAAATQSGAATPIPDPPKPISIQIKTFDDSKLVSNNLISHDGPTLSLTVEDAADDHAANGLVYDVSVIKLVPSAYVKPEFPTTTTLPRTIKFSETGSYNVTVTKSNAGGSQVSSSVITIKPITPPAIPKIASVQDVGSSNQYPSVNTFFDQIDLKGDGHILFQVNDDTVSAIASTPITRPLAILNRTTGQLLNLTDTKVLSTGVSSNDQSYSMTINLDKAALVDRPNQLALIDLWTGEQSVPPFPTFVVNSTAQKQGGNIGSASTGPNTEFPEFTPPRTLPDGFNPSDKVETRVVRLYYFRDAHRVAQIVNRDVRSYNYVAVATARRQAESARTSADQATDLRRQAEVKAVRAAQDARTAERKLKQAQQDFDDAKQQETNALQQSPVVQQQLDEVTSQITENEGRITDAKAELANATTDVAKQQLINSLLLTYEVRRQDLARQKVSLQQQQAALNKVTTDQASIGKKATLDQAKTQVDSMRDIESQQADEDLRDSQIEDRARENQFRQEVAAEHEDPDTYAPGLIGSQDPVRQVSISVIGEGEIQLRGPIKGINIIRMMINQIDAPVGQVRIGIHTVQINGEHGDRMERVAGRIQDYIDHSRFLTVQSAQLLRNAVVAVASRLAVQADAESQGEFAGQLALCRDEPSRRNALQRLRDLKYVRAFFGEDFINELELIDSEFLYSGNKLLSLHSMDTTSLASALFLLALAKNEVREEILGVFETALAGDLPQAEVNYYAAGAGARSVRHPKLNQLVAGHEKLEKLKKFACDDDFKMFAGNAKFQSLRGFFGAQVEGTDTLNPLQREFIRLAQIFKSRLVTELEYNQRIKERGLIEQRLGDYLATLRKQQRRQLDAEETFRVAQTSILEGIQQVGGAVNELEGRIREMVRPSPILNPILTDPQGLSAVMNAKPNDNSIDIKKKDIIIGGISVDLEFGSDQLIVYSRDPRGVQVTGQEIADTIVRLKDSWKKYGLLLFSDTEFKKLDAKIQSLDEFVKQYAKFFQAPVILASDPRYQAGMDIFLYAALVEASNELSIKQRALYRAISPSLDLLDQAERKLVETDILSENPENALRLVGRMIEALNALEDSPVVSTNVDPKLLGVLNKTEDSLRGFIPDVIKVIFARRNFDASRRPVDHKKLLDMLIDDVEDKYIELLEGTRSHTANIDAYIKAIATALDDDFNTQFYYPAFAEIRRASRYYDVNLGNVETTTVLANNRGFAKVEPTATMEFDLPKRDILINEAMNGALAMTKDFGALVNDPTFLSLSKLRSGQPTSSLASGAGAGVNTVRNVVPGLSRSDDEKLFSQQGAGDTRFGSAMEALIPDPAVYKFETGTGFEIRPVIQPDGQSVVFHFNYMYTTNVREPVRADEKHLGRIKRHFIDTDVQLGNYELREVSRYQVALKASRTSRGVPLFEDIPVLGILFRPLPSAESSLQENIVLAQGTVFPTLFDLMGLRWAPAVADLDTLRLRNDDFIVRNRNRDVVNHVFDISSSSVDESLRIPSSERRSDLYRSQQTIPDVHPDSYRGAGLNYRQSHLREGYRPTQLSPESRFIPSDSRDLPPAGPRGEMLVPPSGTEMPFPAPGPAMMVPASGPLDRLPPGVIVPPPGSPSSPSPFAPRPADGPPLTPSTGNPTLPMMPPGASRLRVPGDMSAFPPLPQPDSPAAGRSTRPLAGGGRPAQAGLMPAPGRTALSRTGSRNLPPTEPHQAVANPASSTSGQIVANRPVSPSGRSTGGRLDSSLQRTSSPASAPGTHSSASPPRIEAPGGTSTPQPGAVGTPSKPARRRILSRLLDNSGR